MEEAIINFATYEGSTEYLGMAEWTLPNLERQTVDVTGAGISGTFSAPVLGHFSAMSATANWRTPNEKQAKLMTNEPHTIDLRAAIERRNPTTGAVETVPVKHIMVVRPKSLNMGKVAPASTADASMEFSVSYFATYINGEKITEIDIFNMIAIVNGVDELAATRAALGK